MGSDNEVQHAPMVLYNLSIMKSQQQLYTKASNAVPVQGTISDWFHTQLSPQRPSLSPAHFNIFLKYIMTDALKRYSGAINIWGHTIKNLWFADEIDGLASNEAELRELMNSLDKILIKYSMEISTDMKLMTNSKDPVKTKVAVKGQQHKTMKQFCYLVLSSVKRVNTQSTGKSCADCNGKTEATVVCTQYLLQGPCNKKSGRPSDSK